MSDSITQQHQDLATMMDGARLDVVEKRARIALKSSKSTRTLLQGHIDECAIKQKWVLRVGSVTLGWVVLHSPEAAKAIAEIARILWP